MDDTDAKCDIDDLTLCDALKLSIVDCRLSNKQLQDLLPLLQMLSLLND